MKIRTHEVIRISLTVVVAALVLGSCVSGSGNDTRSAVRAGDLPEWYLNPQDVYPSETFLTAIGTGDSRRDAEQQALAGLSQIFEAEISVDARTSERYSELMTAQGSVSENELRLAQDTSVRSNQTLLNVQYGEAAVDEAGRVHVIAYIERVPTGRVYADLIEKNGEQVESFLQEASSSEDLVREYAYTSAAAVVSATNEVLRDQLRIIAPGFSEIVSLPYDPDRVLQRRADIASRMRTSVSLDGDESGRISGVVRSALSEERFPVSDSDPVFQVTGSMRLDDGEVNDDFQSVRWTLTLDLTGPDGSTLVTFDQQSRASGVSREAAVSFAYNDMEEAVAQGFVGAIRRYFDGLVLDS
ncbi:MAG: LPP20 family lipoprotein [Alkalispirochaeta sp.]